MSQVDAPHQLVGASRQIEEVRALIRCVGKRCAPLLICGESGTGKQLVARHIHACSMRAREPFIPVDCTMLGDDLLEGQLFGHVRESGPHAGQATLGFLRAADGGTLFLDNIEALSSAAQARLLRCILNRAVVPVGAVQATAINVRIIAASSRNLAELVRGGEFRADLHARLGGACIEMPPLRDRPEDVLPLADHFLASLAEFYQEVPKRLSAEAADALQAYAWPGNIEEMASLFERLFAQCSGGQVELDDLPDEIRLGAPPGPAVRRRQAAPLADRLADADDPGPAVRPSIVPHIDCRHLRRLVRRSQRRRGRNGGPARP